MPEHVGDPQTRAALAAHLNALGVRENSYHLFGAHADDAIVMDNRPEGWVVFYCERGGEFELKCTRVRPMRAQTSSVGSSGLMTCCSSLWLGRLPWRPPMKRSMDGSKGMA